MTPASIKLVLQTAKELADALGETIDHVYKHAEEYGVMRIGTGPSPRLRFPDTEQARKNRNEYEKPITRLHAPGRKRKQSAMPDEGFTHAGNRLLPLP